MPKSFETRLEEIQRSVYVDPSGSTQFDTDDGKIHSHVTVNKRGSIDIDISGGGFYDTQPGDASYLPLYAGGFPEPAGLSSRSYTTPPKQSTPPSRTYTSPITPSPSRKSSPRIFEHDTAQKIFKALDIDGSGSLEASEAHKMLTLMRLDHEQIDELFQMADIDRNGHVSLQEFDLLLSSGQKQDLLPPLKAVLAQLEVVRRDLAKKAVEEMAKREAAAAAAMAKLAEHDAEVLRQLEAEAAEERKILMAKLDADRQAELKLLHLEQEATLQRLREHEKDMVKEQENEAALKVALATAQREDEAALKAALATAAAHEHAALKQAFAKAAENENKMLQRASASQKAQQAKLEAAQAAAKKALDDQVAKLRAEIGAKEAALRAAELEKMNEHERWAIQKKDTEDETEKVVALRAAAEEAAAVQAKLRAAVAKAQKDILKQQLALELAQSAVHAAQEQRLADERFRVQENEKKKKRAVHRDTEAEVLKKIFHVIDYDNSGYIDSHEAIRVFSGLGLEMSTIKSLFAQADIDLDGLIVLREFVLVMVRAQETPEMHLPPIGAILNLTRVIVKGIPDSEKRALPSYAHLRPPRVFIPSHMTGFTYETDNIEHCACRLPGTETALNCSVM